MKPLLKEIFDIVIRGIDMSSSLSHTITGYRTRYVPAAYFVLQSRSIILKVNSDLTTSCYKYRLGPLGGQLVHGLYTVRASVSNVRLTWQLVL